MQISEDKRGDVTVVGIAGSVDALTAGEVEIHLDRLVKAGLTRLVVDLSRVDFISSAGLRSFLTTVKSARQTGGDLRLAAAQENVHKVLAMAGFTSIMKSYPDTEAAVASFD